MKTFIKHMNRNPESGATTMLMSLAVIAASAIGIHQMMESSNLTQKVSKLQETSDSSKQLPLAAATIAKSLLALPLAVENDRANLWTSPAIASSPSTTLPIIYPTPYYAGAAGSAPTASNTFSLSSSTTGSSANYQWQGAETKDTVIIYTNDGSRITAKNLDSLFKNPSGMVDTIETAPRSTSTAVYKLRNCDNLGKDASAWTGVYCVAAEITSSNYASSDPSQATRSHGSNKALVQLGMIEPPPPPSCDDVTTSLDNTKLIFPGQTLDLNIKATGVVTGYDINFSVDTNGVDVLSTGANPIVTNWNDVRSVNSQTISYDTKSIVSRMKSGKRLKVSVTLKGARGTAAVCANRPSLVINNYCSKMNTSGSQNFGSLSDPWKLRNDVRTLYSDKKLIAPSWFYGTSWGTGRFATNQTTQTVVCNLLCYPRSTGITTVSFNPPYGYKHIAWNPDDTANWEGWITKDAQIDGNTQIGTISCAAP